MNSSNEDMRVPQLNNDINDHNSNLDNDHHFQSPSEKNK
jgi:hypothetical protein